MYCKAKREKIGRGGYKEEAAAEGERKKLFRRKQPGS
jgi:hypothetical protein